MYNIIDKCGCLYCEDFFIVNNIMAGNLNSKYS